MNKNIYTILIIVLSSLFLFLALFSIKDNKKSFVPDSIDYSDGKYFKDPKTNLCFYGRYLATSNAVLVLVPCSPEVEKVIKQGNE